MSKEELYSKEFVIDYLKDLIEDIKNGPGYPEFAVELRFGKRNVSIFERALYYLINEEE